jgi:Ca-activated chloride channel homolog
MSFETPLLLLSLLVVPVAALLYSAHSRRRERAVAAFGSPALLDSVAPQRPGWRRHTPYALYALALAGLAVALARPEITVAVPDERASIVLATDTSGSMQATDVRPSRLVAARDAGLDFLDDVPREVRVGAVIFNHTVRSIEPPATDRAPVRRALEGVRPSGGTATGEALASSLGLAEQTGTRRRPPPAAIVLLSDGASTHGRDPLPVADAAARLRIPIYTVALGTDAGTIDVETPNGVVERAVPPDRETLRRLADASGGRYFEADDRPQLKGVYERLGSQVAKRDEPREVTSAFAGAGLLLLLAGSGLSLHWFRRLP